MTTFAYSKKENAIAIDGRMSRGSLVASDKYKKWIEADGETYFYIGCVSASKRLVNAVSNGDEYVDEDNEWDCHVILASNPPKEIYVNDHGYIECGEIEEDFMTLGSGESYALSALDMGKTVRQAVQYATTRDVFSGGKISVYDLSKQKFKSK